MAAIPLWNHLRPAADSAPAARPSEPVAPAETTRSQPAGAAPGSGQPVAAGSPPPSAAAPGAAPDPDAAELRRQHARGIVPFDLRKPDESVPTEAQRRALGNLRGEFPGVDVRFDPLTGAPDHILAAGRFLGGPVPGDVDVEAVVRPFLDRHAELFHHTGAALDDARVTRRDTGAHNGMTTVVWQQRLDGLPLFNTLLKANLTRRGEIVALGSHFMADPASATRMSPEDRARRIAAPPVDAATAVSRAAAGLGVALAGHEVRPATEWAAGGSAQRFDAPGLNGVQAALTWLPLAADSLALAWDVILTRDGDKTMFRVLIDAATGGAVARQSLTEDASAASYRVYANPGTLRPLDSPTPMSPGHATPLPDQPPAATRSLITLQAADPTASPGGWINDGDTDTQGNNVDAHLDLNADNSPDLPRPASATRVFDFAMDAAQPPSTYRDAAVSQLFYLCNWVHDRLYGLGFTESAGNFQVNNFGRGGLGNDRVMADAQDGSGTNNANFSTPPDGTPGRMQMYVFTGSNPDRDSSFDSEIVIHEYAHGLSNRLVGGGSGINALQTRGMGEGWSDFYALCLLSEPADNVDGNYAKGGYSTHLLSGLTQNYYFGIRRYPYSTDLNRNPLTLRDIDPAQASPHTGVPRSPLPGSAADGVHNMGEIWCVTLWDARANLIRKLGAAAGNQMILQLVTDGMKISPSNPTFLQARDAVLQADQVLSGGAHLDDLWLAFAKRGMGANAVVPASSAATGVTESFDVPDVLGVTPVAAYVATGEIGGPFAPPSNTYTLSNNGSSNLTWTASSNQSWITLSPSSGALAPGGSTQVTATLAAAAGALPGGLHSASISFRNSGTGLASQRAVTLRAGVVDYFTEVFDASGPQDTDNQSFTFTPNGSASGYAVIRSAAASFPTDPAGGASLTMGDDTYATVTPTGGVTVTVFGIAYSTLHIGSNGYVTFGSGDTSYSQSSSSHFSKPRVAALTDDLIPATGQVTWKQMADRIAVTWLGVREYGGSALVNLQIELFLDGRVVITHLAVGITDGVVGLSRGTGLPADFQESDFSAYPAGSLTLLLPDSAAEGDGLLAGRGSVRVFPASSANLTVSLVCDTPAELTVPASVTVPAGSTNAVFDLTVVNDTLVDGSRIATVRATEPGRAAGTRQVTIHDNESSVLSVSAPVFLIEGAAAGVGTVTSSLAAGRAVTVRLSSSDTTEVLVPPSVEIAAGQTSATFPVTPADDTEIDGPRAATIRAAVTNWTPGVSGAVIVSDNESRQITLMLPPTVAEGGTETGRVFLSGTLTAHQSVQLASDAPARLNVPASVTIPAGATSVVFTVTAPANGQSDGGHTVTVSCSAAGLLPASGSVLVLDNDLHHFTISPIASPCQAGEPVSLTITAVDVNGVALPAYGGTPSITAASASGPVVLSPSAAGPFPGGAWTGTLVFSTLDSGVRVTVSDGAGHSASSNPFDVVAGPVRSFSWSPLPSSAVKDIPLPVAITARDQYGHTAESFQGAVDLAGIGEGAWPDRVRVLTFTAHADLGEEYPNTLRAITRHFTEFDETVTTATDPSTLAALLADQDVLLIPEQEFATAGQLSVLAASWAGTLASFVTNGGSVVVCGHTGSEHLFLTAAGLMGVTKGTPLNVAQLDKPGNTPLNQGVATPFPGNFVSHFTTTDGIPSLVETASGNAVVLHRETGAGRAILIGTDYYTTGTGLDRVIANAVSLGWTTPATIPVSPAVTAGFTSGVWTGQVAVLRATPRLAIRADDRAGHAGESAPLIITDLGVISVTLPASLAEGQPPAAAVVSISTVSPLARTVRLSAQPGGVSLPPDLIIPANQTSAVFQVTLADDTLLNGSREVTVTPEAAGYTGLGAILVLLDNESTELSVSLPSHFTEGQGTVPAGGSLSTTLPRTLPFTARLTSSNPARLTVPDTVILPVGAAPAPFEVVVPENALADGSAPVTVTARVEGWPDGAAATTVRDNDLHHFGVSAVPSPQRVGVPFPLTVTALDVDGETLTGYSGPAMLSATGTTGVVSITPSTATGFTSGVWSGSVTTITRPDRIVVTVADAAGPAGASNPFDVQAGNLDRFEWTLPPGPDVVGLPIPATVSALDMAGNAVADFAGPVTFSAGSFLPASSWIKITEVNPGSPDAVEFANLGPAPVDVSGWRVYLHDDNGSWPAPLPAFTFPNGTICNTGQVFYLQEYGVAPGVFPTFSSGANISWTSSSSSRIAVRLLDEAGQRVDFVCAGAGTPTAITSPLPVTTSEWSGIPVAAPATSSHGYARGGASDGNSSANWSAAAPGIGTPNPGLAYPHTVPDGAPLAPAASGPFVDGLWTGHLSFLDPGLGLRLRATDGHGHTGDSDPRDVYQNGILSVQVPSGVAEDAGTVSGSVLVFPPAATNLAITLASQDTTELTVPSTVVIPAGQTNVPFTLIVVNDTLLDGPQNVEVSATATGFAPARATLVVQDNETSTVTVSLPSTLREGQGAVTSSGYLYMTSLPSSDFTVALASSDPASLAVPATVTLSTTSYFTYFTMTVPDNTLTDGSRPVTVTASIPGWTTVADTVTILDNDVHHFSVSTIPSPQSASVAFRPTLIAQDVNNVTVTSFTGTGNLSAMGSTGPVVISPAVTTAFASGVWTGPVTPMSLAGNVVLTVSTPGGISGASNPFAIQPGPLHHFLWSAIPSPRMKDQPFPITLTAQDSLNNVVTSFQGSAGLEGFAGTPTRSRVRVLSFIGYADTAEEYPRTKQAISNHFTEFDETSTAVTDPAALAALLVGKDVFLVVEQQNATTTQLSALGAAWAPVLLPFVTGGGVVIACSYNTDEHLLLTSAGLLALTRDSFLGSATLAKSPDTALNAGVPASFSAVSIGRFRSTEAATSLAEPTSGLPVVLHRDIGTGHVVMIGTDFFTTGTPMDRIVANAVAWPQVATGAVFQVLPAITPAFSAGVWTGEVAMNGSGPQITMQAGAGPTVRTTSPAFQVTDLGTLTVTAPGSVTEGGVAFPGAVAAPMPAPAARTLLLSSSDPTALAVPESVTLPAGATSAVFTLTIGDDSLYNGPRIVRVTAHLPGYGESPAEIRVVDDETPGLALTLDVAFTEGQPAAVGSGTVNTSLARAVPVEVSLTSLVPGRLTVPATVTLAAGSAAAAFSVTLPDNTLTDGAATATVIARVAGLADASATTTVYDDDLHHFTLSPVAPGQTVGVPFRLVVQARDVNDRVLPYYTGTPTLSATGSPGPIVFSPPIIGTLDGGMWAGDITVTSPATAVVFTVRAPTGAPGNTNPFTVSPGPLHHFAWSAQPASRGWNTPFTVTVTAQDAGNGRVQGYAGSATLSGYVGTHGGTSVVISEVYPGAVDELEFMNVSSLTVDLSGWIVHAYDSLLWPAPSCAFAFPPGSLCPPGQVFRLQENGSSPGVFPQFFLGTNLLWTTDSSSKVAVRLGGPSGEIVDFMCAGTASPAEILVPSPIPAAQWPGTPVGAPVSPSHAYQRVGNADTNLTGNWIATTPSLGAVNSGITTSLFTGHGAPVRVSPASASFLDGTWTGEMTVLQTAVQMRLRAGTVDGYSGITGLFDTLGTMAMTLPPTTVEGQSPVTGNLVLTPPPLAPLAVAFSSSDTSEVLQPPALNLASGQTSATFLATVVNDGLTDGPQAVSISAIASGYANTSAPITIDDAAGPYAAWAAAAGLDVDNQARHLDPDGDGTVNALEFLLNGNPILADAAQTALACGQAPPTPGEPTGFLRVAYRRRDAAEYLPVVLETCPSLGASNWTEILPGVDGVVRNVTENGAAPDDVEYLIPVRAASRVYLRLRMPVP